MYSELDISHHDTEIPLKKLTWPVSCVLGRVCMLLGLLVWRIKASICVEGQQYGAPPLEELDTAYDLVLAVLGMVW